ETLQVPSVGQNPVEMPSPEAMPNPEGGYYVSDYVWRGFGMDFAELIDTKSTIEECYMLLPKPSNNP
ncbi:MAG: hypothetical protein J6A01_12860, partial [Proteobacteria bacterium]|nr:hypothetical protein [Pseudomonadota bacterium]